MKRAEIKALVEKIDAAERMPLLPSNLGPMAKEMGAVNEYAWHLAEKFGVHPKSLHFVWHFENYVRVSGCGDTAVSREEMIGDLQTTVDALLGKPPKDTMAG